MKIIRDLSHIQAYVESLTRHPLKRDEGVQHGDPDRNVTRATVAWMASPEAIRAARQDRSDLMIVQENLYDPFRFAAECGIPMIETSREVSENPGLRRFAAMLNAAFPNLSFAFYGNECVWQMR